MSGPVILYVHDLRGSGVVTNAIALARRMGAERETILCAGYDEGLNRGVDVSPATLVTLSTGPQPPKAKLLIAPALAKFIRSSGASTIVSMGNLGHRAAWIAAKAADVKTVFRISNEVGRANAGWWKNFRRNRWHRRLRRSWTKGVLVGRALAARPLFAQAIAKGDAAYIANGVDIDGARAKVAAPSPHAWFEDGGPPIVLAIGRLHPQKNLQGLIEAASIARQSTPFRLVIIGSGSAKLTAKLAALADQSGMADDILFAGEQSNVFAWLSRAALFALPSHWEGSSTALLEAMAVGTPILASRQAGDASHVLDDGKFGRLVDANDPADIAAGIVDQLRDPVRPCERVEDFRLENTHRQYLEVLRDL